ncbi:hypothetical protein JHK82_031075 [Glycine max]|nr:hypothetical protein JHK85_031722 [Glycine max]KAG4994344.1 hypothetical protein JHK86_031171 [Glycine max]KAG5124338.1 hypothetical protein JHK82_031075 [Glycine max]KAG5145757.1 hypothetical protein JHK84_031300 [Glycine max]
MISRGAAFPHNLSFDGPIYKEGLQIFKVTESEILTFHLHLRKGWVGLCVVWLFAFSMSPSLDLDKVVASTLGDNLV